MDDEARHVMKPRACERYPLGPLEDTAKAGEGLHDIVIDIKTAEQREILVGHGGVELPLWNRRYAMAAAGIVLGVELWVAHDEHRYPGRVSGTSLYGKE